MVYKSCWLGVSVVGRRSFTGELSLACTCSWWLTIYMGKPSAVGQPTRPTQPFILTGSINYSGLGHTTPPTMLQYRLTSLEYWLLIVLISQVTKLFVDFLSCSWSHRRLVDVDKNKFVPVIFSNYWCCTQRVHFMWLNLGHLKNSVQYLYMYTWRSVHCTIIIITEYF